MSYLANRQSAKLWRKTWPFALLCLLSSTVWLLLDRYPQITFSLASGAAACGLAAMCAIGLGLALRSPQGRLAELLKPATGGGLVIAGPAIGAFLHASLNAGSLAIALAMTPVAVIVAEPVLSEREPSVDGLWPGLAAAVGLLLVLPAPSVSDWRNDLAMLLAPVLTGVGCVIFRQAKPVAWKASAGFLGGVVVFGLGAVVEGAIQHGLPSISLAAVAIDTPLFALSFVALSRLTASQYGARYALVPLLVLIQGPLLLGSMVVTWRGMACAALLLVAGVALLRAGSSEEAPNPHRLWG